MTIEVNGQTIETDEEGYLANRSDWNEDVAKEMARLDRLRSRPRTTGK